jgi:hypothetical protein
LKKQNANRRPVIVLCIFSAVPGAPAQEQIDFSSAATPNHSVEELAGEKLYARLYGKEVR